MKLSPPKQITFWVAVIIWIVALVMAFLPQTKDVIAFASQTWQYWLALLAGLILALGNILNGL
jgi:hypothetical protein